MNGIIVEPAVLESTASTMENINMEVNQIIKELYGTVDMLKAFWQGEDNTAFVNQIIGYQDDFHKIDVLMIQYIEFLRNSARAYRQTQNELAVQVLNLTN